jgi:hypothetical protein
MFSRTASRAYAFCSISAGRFVSVVSPSLFWGATQSCVMGLPSDIVHWLLALA